MAAKLMNQANPAKTGTIHSLLAVHVGMRVRLLDHLEKSGSGLVKDAEGTVVRIVVNELDETLEEEAISNSAPTIYLRHMPKGIWVRMDKYVDAPFSKVLQRSDATLTLADAKDLVFVEARIAD